MVWRHYVVKFRARGMSSIRKDSLRRGVVVACAGAALLLVLSGCGPMLANMPLVGEPPDAQKRPEVQPAYPAIFRPPPDPEAGRAMSTAERTQMQTDLQTARDRAAAERRQQINKRAARPPE
jgi:hypothetical protein